MEIEKYIKNLQIEKIEPGDTIIINFTEDCDLKTLNNYAKAMVDCFPKNNICCTHPELIESIEVKK